MDKEATKKFVEEEDQKIMEYCEGREPDGDEIPLEAEDDMDELPDDKLYLYDLLSMDPLLAMQLQSMAEKLPEGRIVQILTSLAIRAAASVNNRNPVEGYYWATLLADLIQAICVKREIDPMPISEFINTEQFDYLLRQFETVTSIFDDDSEKV